MVQPVRGPGCPSCGRRLVLNAHYGICNVCLYRAKRLAVGYLAEREWRGDAAILAAARKLRDQFQRGEIAHTVGPPRDQPVEALNSTVYACEDRDGGPECGA
jgi:hypothetical protein